jgi:hypothetical protein
MGELIKFPLLSAATNKVWGKEKPSKRIALYPPPAGRDSPQTLLVGTLVSILEIRVLKNHN